MLMSIDDAIKEADIVILGIRFETIKKSVVANSSSLAEKIIVAVRSDPIGRQGRFYKGHPGRAIVRSDHRRAVSQRS